MSKLPPKSVTRNSNLLAWFVVVVAGLVVLAVVWGLELSSRLDAGQNVLDGARPVFTEERVAGDRVGITMIGNVADMVDPIVDAEGGAAGEVVPLVELVAGATGPEDARRLREAAGEALFLVPGYGAQGAGARDAVAGFVRRGALLEGGVVNASRSVASPAGSLEARSGVEWEALVDRAMTTAQVELVAATRG